MKRCVLISAVLIVVVLAAVMPVAADVVPNVVGMKSQKAMETLTKAKFSHVITNYATDKADANDHVYQQSPPAGTNLPRGSRVNVIVYRYQQPPAAKPAVPNVVGKDLAAAGQDIGKAGYKMASQETQTNSKDMHNKVYAQNPPAGAAAPAGSEVKVSVYRFTDPGQSQPVVPQVVGARAQDANQALLGKGFKVSTAYIDTPVKEHDGIVVRQDPAPGQKVNPGTVVKLAVNRFKNQPIAVPMVTNTSAQQATSMLLSQGFKVSSTYVDTPMKEKNGYVSKQTPAAGQKANPGTVITLEVYRFKEEPTVKMPNLLGMKCADASTALSQLGVKPSNGLISSPNPAQGGLVARQAVTTGTSVKKGETVTFDCYMTEKQSRDVKNVIEKAQRQPQQYNPPIPPDSTVKKK